MIKILSLLFTCMLCVSALAGKYHPAVNYIHPLPGSNLHSEQTTIILKLDTIYVNQITNLDTLISVMKGSDIVSGNTYFATDGYTIIFKPHNHLQAATEYTVEIATSQFSGSNFVFTFETAHKSGNTYFEPEVFNSPTSPSSAETTNSIPTIKIINGVSVPSGFPEINVTHFEATPSDNKIFTSAFASGRNYILISDNNGTPLFYRKFVSRVVNFLRQDNGQLSIHRYGTKDYQILDSNYREIKTVISGHGYRTDNHECQILPNGHILLIGQDFQYIDMRSVYEGGNSNSYVKGFPFQELDLKHDVVFEFRTWDHFSILDATHQNFTNSTLDPVHMNSVDIDYDGNYLISSKTMDEVTKIDNITGEIIWRLGGKNNMFDFVNDDIMFSYQHDFRPVEGQPNSYTLFDNGNYHSPPFSRAVQYQLDTTTMTATKTWEFRYSPDRYSNAKGNFHLLDNGNYWIDWTNSSPVRATEVTANGEIVLEFEVENSSTYRSIKAPWNGYALEPYLILEPYDGLVRLIFNKFGDNNVAYYKVHYAPEMGNYTLADTSSMPYYDLQTFPWNGNYYFAITAILKDGSESDTSNIESTNIFIIKPGENLLTNGDFSDKFDSWITGTSGDAVADWSSDNERVSVTISNPGTDFHHVHLRQENLPIFQNKTYIVKYDAWVTDSKIIEVKIAENGNDFTNYSQFGYIQITPDQAHYNHEFTMTDNTDLEARLVVNLGLSATAIQMDNFVLKEKVEDTVNNTYITNKLDIIFTPNPCKYYLHINFNRNNLSETHINIYDISGKQVYSETPQNPNPSLNHTINMSEFGKGVYLVTLSAYSLNKGESFRIVQKVIKN